jgi:hypothetical protein
MNFREIGLEIVDWIELAQAVTNLALVNTVMNFRVPQKAGNFLAE